MVLANEPETTVWNTNIIWYYWAVLLRHIQVL